MNLIALGPALNCHLLLHSLGQIHHFSGPQFFICVTYILTVLTSQDVRGIKRDTGYNSARHIVTVQEKANELQQPQGRLSSPRLVHPPKPRVLDSALKPLQFFFFYCVVFVCSFVCLLWWIIILFFLLGVWVVGTVDAVDVWALKAFDSAPWLCYQWIGGSCEAGVIKSKAKVSPKRHWSIWTRQVEAQHTCIWFPVEE